MSRWSYRTIPAVLCAVIAFAVLAADAAADNGDVPGVGAQEVTIDFSTYGSGQIFDPLFYRTDGIVFPPERCGSAGCTSWFVGFVQGDEALLQHPFFDPVTATFTRPVEQLSLQVAPALQGTATYTLAAADSSGEIIATSSLTITQDQGDPANGAFGYFTISLGHLARPAKSFTLASTFVRSSFGFTAIDYGVSSITYTHWGGER